MLFGLSLFLFIEAMESIDIYIFSSIWQNIAYSLSIFYQEENFILLSFNIHIKLYVLN
jgi:hypothetical protein